MTRTATAAGDRIDAPGAAPVRRGSQQGKGRASRAEDDGHEPGGHAVGQPGEGRLGRAGLLDELDDLGEQGVATHALGLPKKKGAGAVDGARADGVARLFGRRNRFAGQHAASST